MTEIKPLDVFIVHIPKRINDTIEVGGVQMYVDNRFNEFEHRVNEGEVIATPYKYDTGVSVGDTLYFHHHVVINDGQPLTGHDDTYVVRYDHKHTVNSQAIAFKDEYDQVFSLSGWVVLSPVDPDTVKSEQILTVDLSEKRYVRGQIAFPFVGMHDTDLMIGDVVGFPPNRDYTFEIDGETYFRVRKEDLLYKL